MTIHLTWMTPVWILAGIGAGMLVRLGIQLIYGMWYFRRRK